MVTVIFATYAGGVIGALLLFGRLSDQVGRRRALLPGLALSGLSAVSFLLAHGLAPLLLGRVLSGLSAGIFTGTATAALVDLAGPEGRARASLVATMVNIGGLACGPLLAGLLAEFAGAPLRLTFWVDLALLVPAVALVWAMPEAVPGNRPGRIRPQRLHVPLEVRGPFIRAAVAGGVVAGLGQGLSFRAGLASVNEATPANRRGEVGSSFFVVAYVAISVPVVGLGVVAQLTTLRVAGLIFAALVAVLAVAAVALLAAAKSATSAP